MNCVVECKQVWIDEEESLGGKEKKTIFEVKIGWVASYVVLFKDVGTQMKKKEQQ